MKGGLRQEADLQNCPGRGMARPRVLELVFLAVRRRVKHPGSGRRW